MRGPSASAGGQTAHNRQYMHRQHPSGCFCILYGKSASIKHSIRLVRDTQTSLLVASHRQTPLVPICIKKIIPRWRQDYAYLQRALPVSCVCHDAVGTRPHQDTSRHCVGAHLGWTCCHPATTAAKQLHLASKPLAERPSLVWQAGRMIAGTVHGKSPLCSGSGARNRQAVEKVVHMASFMGGGPLTTHQHMAQRHMPDPSVLID